MRVLRRTVWLLLAIAAPVALVGSLLADLYFDRSACQRVDGRLPPRDICGGDLAFAGSSRTWWLIALVGLLVVAAVGEAVWQPAVATWRVTPLGERIVMLSAMGLTFFVLVFAVTAVIG